MGEKQHYSNQIRAKFKSAMLNHEFIAYYQPKVNIVTQELIGMEALVRWETEEGSVNPQDFVGIFEDTSAIIELDRCMLLQVCRDIKRWESMGLSVPRISVNLSRRNLNNYDVADIVASVLDEYHVDHDKVEIEVTETVNSEGFESLSQFISKMKKYGIKVSIDDFGTGYSSLNLLKNLNADVLKIDRSFVDLEEFTEKDELLVKSIVELAKSYSMETIMEGVENEEQIRFLYKCGCMNVQGYFFDKPLTKEAVTDRIQLGKYDKKYKLK
jgi:EAL domain-containing protein (putative c-di-GMP-specific phosphodiesterase class I)